MAGPRVLIGLSWFNNRVNSCCFPAGFSRCCSPWAPEPGCLAGRQPAPARAQVGGEAAAKPNCATCHKLPPPDVLPRSTWRDEIARMFLIQQNQPEPIGPPGTAARMVTLPPDWQSIVGVLRSERARAAAPAGPVAGAGSNTAVPETRRVGRRRSGEPGGGEHPPGRSGPRRPARDGVERHAQRHRLQGQTVRGAAGVRGDRAAVESHAHRARRSRWRWRARLPRRRPGRFSAVRPQPRRGGVAPRAQRRDLRADAARRLAARLGRRSGGLRRGRPSRPGSGGVRLAPHRRASRS